jgi:hypothetical protein
VSLPSPLLITLRVQLFLCCLPLLFLCLLCWKGFPQLGQEKSNSPFKLNQAASLSL